VVNLCWFALKTFADITCVLLQGSKAYMQILLLVYSYRYIMILPQNQVLTWP